MDMSRLELIAEQDTQKREIMTLFMEMAQTNVRQMEDAMKHDDAHSWKEASHSLKGASGNLGITALQKACAEAEHSGTTHLKLREGQLLQIMEEIAKLEHHLDKFSFWQAAS